MLNRPPCRMIRTPFTVSSRGARPCSAHSRVTRSPAAARPSAIRCTYRSDPPPSGWLTSRQFTKRTSMSVVRYNTRGTLVHPSSGFDPRRAPPTLWSTRMNRSASLSRSVSLFQAFLHEQDDPQRFYSVLAADSVAQLSHWVDLAGTTVLDVGGGPGYFADAFRGAGATYVGLEPDAGEMAARGEPEPGTLRASGEQLPIRTGAVDVCYSSNVLEHVRNPETMADEMVRVTKPG